MNRKERRSLANECQEWLRSGLLPEKVMTITTSSLKFGGKVAYCNGCPNQKLKGALTLNQAILSG